MRYDPFQDTSGVQPGLAALSPAVIWALALTVLLLCGYGLPALRFFPAPEGYLPLHTALAKSKNCMACHAIDKKVVGPAYKDVAKKFAGQKDAVDVLSNAILKGSKGVWGPVPMPPNAQVSEAEAKTLATWVMSLK